MMKVVMLGDVMGEGGLKTLEEKLPSLLTERKPDITIANGENAAGGFGVTEDTMKRMFGAGINVITSGNHIWEKREFWPFLDSEERILRPANYPDAPGRGWIKITLNNQKPILVINLQGREYMNPIDCPFRCFDRILSETSNDKNGNYNNEAGTSEKPVILVDFHAESGREKEAFGFYADGRAAVVTGTHTHVQTADEKILPKGTAYISDLGMTGVTGAVIGMDPRICIDRAKKQVLFRMEEAAANAGSGARVQGIFCEIDDDSGIAVNIERINF